MRVRYPQAPASVGFRGVHDKTNTSGTGKEGQLGPAVDTAVCGHPTPVHSGNYRLMTTGWAAGVTRRKVRSICVVHVGGGFEDAEMLVVVPVVDISVQAMLRKQA